MSQPIIIIKKFLLAGFEAAIDLKESRWQGMDDVKSSLKAHLGGIRNRVSPERYAGVWGADPDADYGKPENHTRRLYFYGVEVSCRDGVPEVCAIKELPEHSFAVFKENDHGSPKYELLNAAGYTPDREFQQNHALDMEIYDDIDAASPEWDVWIPVE